MTTTDWLIISALLIGPILAVQVQKAIESWREAKLRKLYIFKTLMATRGTPLSRPHVEALNRIDLEFFEKKPKQKKAIDAWKIYRDHLYSLKIDYTDPNYSVKLDAWAQQSNELLVDLLYEMAQSVGYDFDKIQLKRGSYTPQGYADIENEQNFIRGNLVDLFLGKKAFPVQIVENPSQNDSEEEHNRPLNSDAIKPPD